MVKQDFLKEFVEHIDIKTFDSKPILDQFAKMAFQARNISRASLIFDQMTKDTECAVILCLAGSIFSAGLKKTVLELLDCNIADAIVSTGAIIVDQDFFEALGFRHYQGTPAADDDELMNNAIDRIYDTYIDEDELRICDDTIRKIADSIQPKPYSSREFIMLMGKYLVENNLGLESVVRKAYEKKVPIFVPAFSDSSAGFGLVHHQSVKGKSQKVSIDSVKDFLELTKIKIFSGETGLFMIGGGVPKNFAQDITVSAEILGKEVNMHKYAVQITVADERDGGLSGSTLKEAHSWGKVDQGAEQMVFSEATVALPLIASYVYHRKNWQNRKPKKFNEVLDENE
ncbi:deoxyhypusine synthase [candidate division WOR-3 bacterium]|nr:deoxyhypusine synthase [candidate division WOR-3 bacterium]